jgi:superfamily I DNA and/or RNA helicase
MSRNHGCSDLELAQGDRQSADGRGGAGARGRVELKSIKKITNGEGPDDLAIEVTSANEDARLGDYPLVGGTAWLFARSEHDQKFDYLFVDEAGQVSLANIVATGTAARNIVLR